MQRNLTNADAMADAGLGVLPDKGTYIPLGCDQQGRRKTSVYVSRQDEEDQSNGLTMGEALYVYGVLIIAFLAMVSCSVAVWGSP